MILKKDYSPSQDNTGKHEVINRTVHRLAECINLENQYCTLPSTIIILAYRLNTKIAWEALHLIRKVNRKKFNTIASAYFDIQLILPKILPPILI